MGEENEFHFEHVRFEMPEDMSEDAEIQKCDCNSIEKESKISILKLSVYGGSHSPPKWITGLSVKQGEGTRF